MTRYCPMIFAALMLIAVLSVLTAYGQANQFSFQTVDNNSPAIEKQGIFTGASLAADLDGEGVSNDVALIDQSGGSVFIVLYDKHSTSIKSISSISTLNIFDKPYLPTSVTAFTDAMTGL